MIASKKEVSGLPVDLLERMAEVLKLLAHVHRLQIVEMLERTDGAPVFEIMERLHLPQAATSQHLNAMKRVGLLRADRRGKEVWYSIADPRALTILNCIRKKKE
jgi:DNA-binding transcriptional ArsR family regulator